jgi:hypothetical protein
METFDSLTSKFNRISDIYSQRILRSIWILLHEERLPFIDLLNRAEKIWLISSADKLLEIRDTRNQIVHEYIPEAIRDMIPEVIMLISDLNENIQKTKDFLVARTIL